MSILGLLDSHPGEGRSPAILLCWRAPRYMSDCYLSKKIVMTITHRLNIK